MATPLEHPISKAEKNKKVRPQSAVRNAIRTKKMLDKIAQETKDRKEKDERK